MVAWLVERLAARAASSPLDSRGPRTSACVFGRGRVKSTGLSGASARSQLCGRGRPEGVGFGQAAAANEEEYSDLLPTIRGDKLTVALSALRRVGSRLA